MRITHEDCCCPTFRILECWFENKYVVVDFNKFEINTNTKVIRVGTLGSEEMLNFSLLKPYYDDETDKNYFLSLKKEYDKIISDYLIKSKKKQKEKTKSRKGQVVY